MQPQIGDRLGPYLLLQGHGPSGAGLVFLAEHEGLKQHRVLKVLSKDLMTDSSELVLRTEAQALRAIGHENVIEVTDLGQDIGDAPRPGEPYYFVTELVHGRPLVDLLSSYARRGSRLPLPRALYIGRQIGAALAAAHDVDVIHRHLKPASVLLTKRGQESDFVKVLEFGVVDPRESEQGRATTRPPGVLVGSPSYMAPEQLRQTPGDFRIDIYSFGILLFELCVGRRPFEGKEIKDILRQHLLSPPPAPQSLLPAGTWFPPALDTLLRRCLEKRPEIRPGSMHEVVLTLAAIIDAAGPRTFEPDDPTAEDVYALPKVAGEFPRAITMNHTSPQHSAPPQLTSPPAFGLQASGSFNLNDPSLNDPATVAEVPSRRVEQPVASLGHDSLNPFAMSSDSLPPTAVGMTPPPSVARAASITPGTPQQPTFVRPPATSPPVPVSTFAPSRPAPQFIPRPPPPNSVPASQSGAIALPGARPPSDGAIALPGARPAPTLTPRQSEGPTMITAMPMAPAPVLTPLAPGELDVPPPSGPPYLEPTHPSPLAPLAGAFGAPPPSATGSAPVAVLTDPKGRPAQSDATGIWTPPSAENLAAPTAEDIAEFSDPPSKRGLLIAAAAVVAVIAAVAVVKLRGGHGDTNPLGSAPDAGAAVATHVTDAGSAVATAAAVKGADAGLAALDGGAVAVVVDAGAAVPVVVDAGVVAPTAKPVKVSFKSTPPGASVWVGAAGSEAQLGVTPFTLPMPTDPPELRVVFRMDGRTEVVTTLVVKAGAEAAATLKSNAPPKPKTNKPKSSVAKEGDLINPF